VSAQATNETKVVFPSINLARGLIRIWIVGTILWSSYWVFWYIDHCRFYPQQIACWNSSRNYYYDNQEFPLAFLGWTIGAPMMALLIGALALWVGRWIAKGFRPSQPQAGE
jgi:hypothetical protein